MDAKGNKAWYMVMKMVHGKDWKRLLIRLSWITYQLPCLNAGYDNYSLMKGKLSTYL